MLHPFPSELKREIHALEKDPQQLCKTKCTLQFDVFLMYSSGKQPTRTKHAGCSGGMSSLPGLRFLLSGRKRWKGLPEFHPNEYHSQPRRKQLSESRYCVYYIVLLISKTTRNVEGFYTTFYESNFSLSFRY